MKTSLHIPHEQAGRRLDQVLAGMTGRSRSRLQSLFKEGLILVNDHPAARSLVVAGGERVTIKEPKAEVSPPAPELTILYEDQDMVVIDKPAGLNVHSSRSKQSEPTVAAFTAGRVIDDDHDRPGIVHRLDKDTSGVLLVAKHPIAKAYLQSQFKERKVKKTYTALVEGQIKDDKATIRLPLARHRSRPLKRAVIGGGREAITHYQVLQRFGRATLIKVNIETGRTHQIRVHFSHLGHPIVGDKLYGRVKGAPPSRLFLHASEISLQAPSGKMVRARSQLPKDFDEYVEALGNAV